MVAEIPENQGQQDPVLERAEKTLQKIDAKEDARVDELESRKKELETEKKALDAQILTLSQTGKSEDSAKATRYQNISDRLAGRIVDLEVKIKFAQEKAAKKEGDVLTGLSTQADALGTQADGIRAQDVNADARATELKQNEERAVVLRGLVQSDPENRGDHLKELTSVQARIEALKAQDTAGDLEKREAALRAGRERLLAQRQAEAVDHAKDEAEGNAALESLNDEDPAAKKTESGTEAPKARDGMKGIAERQGENVHRIVDELLAMNVDPKNPKDMRNLGLKKIWLRIVYAFSSKGITWDKDMTASEKTHLKEKTGLSFQPLKKGSTESKLVFGKPSDKYQEAGPQSQRVLEEYFGREWYTKFKSLEPDDTLKDLRANLDPEDQDGKVFLDDLEKNGVGEEKVLTWLEENGSKMKAENPKIAHDTPASAESAEKPEESLVDIIKREKFNESTKLSDAFEAVGMVPFSLDPEVKKTLGNSEIPLEKVTEVLTTIPWTSDSFQEFNTQVSKLKVAAESLGLKDPSLPPALVGKINQELADKKHLSPETKTELQAALVPFVENIRALSTGTITLKQALEGIQKNSTDEAYKKECEAALALLKENNPTVEEKPKTTKVDPEAQGLIDEWLLTVLDTTISDSSGKVLVELKEGETADLEKADGGLRLTIHSGDTDTLYDGVTLEAFKKSLARRNATPSASEAPQP